MADEPRRSVRATKGQHTKDRDLPDQQPPAKGAKGKKGKGKGGKAVSSEPDEADEEDAIIRCICGATEDDEGLMMIVCDKCEAWQHNLCMDVTEVEDELLNEYYCEQCAPDKHVELLAAIDRGEKPWEAKKKQRQDEEKARKKAKKGKKGRGGGTKPRPSDVTATPAGDDSSIADSAVKVDTGNKRKLAENGFKDERLAEVAKEPPQDSPLLSKRRKSSHYAMDSPVSDRRQSIIGRRASIVGPIAGNIDELSDVTRKKVVTALSKDLVKIINDATKEGSFRIPDGHTPSSLSSHIALQIEYGLVGAHAPDDKQYGEQFRTIHHNITKNKTLASRILSGSLMPEELAAMSSDDMASDELQRKMAAMKEEADKQSILIQEEGPRVRKTHKGEEIIEDTSAAKGDDTMFAPPVIRRRPTEDTEMKDADAAAEEQNTVELPEDVGNRHPLTVDTASGAPVPAHARRESQAFDINSVWSSIHSPEHEGVRPMQQPPRRRSSFKAQDTSEPPPQSAIVDDDVDRLLNDDEPADFEPDEHDPDALWSGKLIMASVGEFGASAKWVAGGDPSGYVPWTQLLPQSFEVSGRIPIASANDYIAGMRHAGRGTDVTILSVTPVATQRDEAVFDAICTYFNNRGRWGVLATMHNEKLKDSYLVPVDIGAPLPDFFQFLEDSIAEQHREGKMLLVVMVVRGPTPPPSADATPQVPDPTAAQGVPVSGAVQPPHPASSSVSAAPGQPQFSPVVHQGPFEGTPPVSAPGVGGLPSIPPLAVQILGDFVHTPTVQMMMAAVPDMSENQLRNLRDVLEKAPETRSDVGVLSMHLKARSGGEQ